MEIFEDKTKTVRFYFTHSDENFTTGIMVIQPNRELPKHNRPLAVENLVQIFGSCVMKLFDLNDMSVEKILNPGDFLSIPKGQYHIHSNPFNSESITLFKAQGDITDIMQQLKSTFNTIPLG